MPYVPVVTSDDPAAIYGVRPGAPLGVVLVCPEAGRAPALHATLERGGHRTVTAASLERALELYAEGEADCALIDFSALERLPRPGARGLQRAGHHVPLLALGPAISGELVRERLREFDLQGYVELGDAAGLLAAVDAWGRRARVWREAERRASAHGRTLLESISAAVLWIDAAGALTEWNGASARLFGLPRSSVIGTPFRAVPIRWADPTVIERILAVAAGDQATRIDDIRYTRPDGREGFLGMTVNVVVHPGGAPELLILGRDITSHKQQSAQVLQSQKLEAIGQLAAGVAHEINTPIQYIGDNLAFLREAFGALGTFVGECAGLQESLRQAGLTQAADEMQRVMRAADVGYLMEQIPIAIAQSLEGNERVGQIVRAMKDFSHPGTDEKTSADLNDGVRNTVAVSRNEWKYVAEVHLELDADLPKVLCFPSEINQVLLNLIVNAAQAVGDVVKGTDERGSITVRTSRDGDHVLVQVIDTGRGIPEAIRSRIFDPFFTTKEVGKGTGQGLSIARTVVDKHRGTIDVESTVGVGTTFSVRLPIEPPTS
jgi:two-component system NtrC family sensor kinase